MLNKKLLAAALLVAITGTAHAETAATANVKWVGLVDSVTDGETIKITGAGGGAIENGTLSVSSDASFTATSVVVEARYIADATDSSYAANDLAEAQWTFTNVQYIVDGNIITTDGIKITDLYTNSVVLDAATPGKELGTVGAVLDTKALNLQPSFDASSEGLEAIGTASLQVGVAAQLAI